MKRLTERPIERLIENDEIDRALAREDDILPSSGFAASVMDAVRREAAAPPPIPFPWKRALPGLVVAGVGLAAVYPSLIASMVGYYGTRARRTGNILFALASCGGAIMPWLVGFVSTHAASLRAGLLAPMVGCLAMLGLQFILPKPILI